MTVETLLYNSDAKRYELLTEDELRAKLAKCNDEQQDPPHDKKDDPDVPHVEAPKG